MKKTKFAKPKWAERIEFKITSLIVHCFACDKTSFFHTNEIPPKCPRCNHTGEWPCNCISCNPPWHKRFIKEHKRNWQEFIGFFKR